MTRHTWSDWHLLVWQRWPVLALSGTYGLLLGLYASIFLTMAHFWPAGSNLGSSFYVTMAMIFTPSFIAAYLKRPLTLGEQLRGALLCTLLAMAYLYLVGTVHPPSLTHLGVGFVGFYLMHVFFFSPWVVSMWIRDRSGAAVQADPAHPSVPSRYAHFWKTYPAHTALAHYALFIVVFALLAHGPFSHHGATGHPQRGFLVAMLFVMPWLYAYKTHAKPTVRAWLWMALAGSVLYWLAGYSTGEIQPSSPRQMLNSLAVTLLYHLLMFSPWLVGFWLKMQARAA